MPLDPFEGLLLHDQHQVNLDLAEEVGSVHECVVLLLITLLLKITIRVCLLGACTTSHCAGQKQHPQPQQALQVTPWYWRVAILSFSCFNKHLLTGTSTSSSSSHNCNHKGPQFPTDLLELHNRQSRQRFFSRIAYDVHSSHILTIFSHNRHVARQEKEKDEDEGKAPNRCSSRSQGSRPRRRTPQ